jgi:hypothetical protein
VELLGLGGNVVGTRVF